MLIERRQALCAISEEQCDSAQQLYDTLDARITELGNDIGLDIQFVNRFVDGQLADLAAHYTLPSNAFTVTDYGVDETVSTPVVRGRGRRKTKELNESVTTDTPAAKKSGSEPVYCYCRLFFTCC